METEIKDLNMFIELINNLINQGEELLLLDPIASGKWSVLEILYHIWLWDKYIIEHMLAKMKRGDTVTFINHELINSQVNQYTESKEEITELFERFIETRIELIKRFEELQTEKTFYVGTKECNSMEFINRVT